jgi:hypothetical protein
MSSSRRLLLYFSWSRPGEAGAPLLDIDDRFPAIFELRRLLYPTLEDLSNPEHVDQGIAGFLDHIQKPNFAAFAELAEALTGREPVQIERVGDDGVENQLDDALIASADTIVERGRGRQAFPSRPRSRHLYLSAPRHRRCPGRVGRGSSRSADRRASAPR